MSTSVCDSGHLMPVDEAIATLLAQAPPPPATQVIGLELALGRVIAEELFSPLDLPGFDNSAMDGYALRAEDVPAEGGYLMLAGRIAAGQHSTANVQAGQAVAAGAELLVLEAMKMELAVRAPCEGLVSELRVAAGDFVEADAVLARVAAEAP